MKPTKLFLALAVAVLLGTNICNAQSLTDTYWRNPKTGDWVIGFTGKHVIYDNAVWDIMEQTERKGGYTFTISNGRETKDIKVSPTKKEERTITIDKKVSVKCSPITTSTLPDYPTRDDRQGFKDNGYRMGDSVTIVGWLKDMPAEAWERGKEFEVAIMNILTDEQDSYYAPLDSLGRFAFKVPLFNTSQAFLDWKRSRICTVLEPNEIYFLLVDFTTGQRLFMGTDARLQNELIAYPHGWLNERIPHDGATYEEAIAFMESVDSVHKALDSELEERIANHPKLSKRYIDYVKGYYIAGHGESLMQARFYIAAPTVPQEFMDYAAKHIWEKMHPYTLYRDYNSFLRNYIGQIDVKKMTAVDYLKIMADKNTIILTEEERYAVDNFDKVKSAMRAARTAEERQNIEDTYNVNKVMNTLNNLIPRMQKELNIEIICNHSMNVFDSIPYTPELRDIFIARRLCMQIESTRTPLYPEICSWMEKEICLSAAKAAVTELNEKYLAIQRRDFANASSLKSSDDVEGMSDGEKILRKLIEPYKGKFILLDVWGTWCGPCKAALAKSQEEYEHLKGYDIVYLYLANRSDEESWKNVIKEYNVTGDNVVHYNLPAEQQTAIEHFLGVNSFPTYKLIDRNGNILDVNADPRDLNALENLLKTMNGTKN
ncbi:MAG: TlpA family protein disulfide reductase [Bacteroidaceae bacterium]|nr:TlpA family protein disulfide reductase [Bacteroidaceae bacterium]